MNGNDGERRTLIFSQIQLVEKWKLTGQSTTERVIWSEDDARKIMKNKKNKENKRNKRNKKKEENKKEKKFEIVSSAHYKRRRKNRTKGPYSEMYRSIYIDCPDHMTEWFNYADRAS